MKRKIKKQLKEDELVTGFQKFLEFAKTWQKEIIIFAVVVAVLAALYGSFQLIRAQQAKKESRRVGEILALRADLAKNPQNVAKLEQLGGTEKAARLAFISLATYWIEQGNLDKALASLAKIKDIPKDFFYYQAQDLTAQVEILKGRYDQAIQILKKIEEAKPKDYLLDVVLYHHAEALEKKGQPKEARDLYKKVQDEYAQTYFGYDASAKVKKLESAK
ncbi:MAG: tetratricopeptide repeat protein [Candidatus Aminicenantes bacterium]|nr:tetratricopeptide repeat protein [Candidatus Aminicenantes bacterium]